MPPGIIHYQVNWFLVRYPVELLALLGGDLRKNSEHEGRIAVHLLDNGSCPNILMKLLVLSGPI
jgi:hypothetical protein